MRNNQLAIDRGVKVPLMHTALMTRNENGQSEFKYTLHMLDVQAKMNYSYLIEVFMEVFTLPIMSGCGMLH